MTKYCQINLDKDNYHALVYAVKNHYWYQMYIGKYDVIFGQRARGYIACLIIYSK